MPTIQFKGKTFVQNHHLAVPYHQLVPDKEKSRTNGAVGLNDNLIIHGDNLVALKALLPTYAGKVQCIYIDPPYNTGNEGWVYNDNVKSPIVKEWIGKVVGKEGEDLTRHDKWLCMMMPRLKLLRELLSEDGAIFISIDDNEQHSLRSLCDEVFSAQNFVTNIIWQKKYSPQNDAQYFSDMHDFLLVYAKNKENWKPNALARTESQDAAYKNPDNDPRGIWKATDATSNKSKTQRPNLYFSVTNPTTGENIFPTENRVWRYSKEVFEQAIADNRVWWGKDGTNKVPSFKSFLTGVKQGRVPSTIWSYQEVGHNQSAKQELNSIFADNAFETPKPTTLIKRVLELSTDENSIILDSFAGSGTTAQAVMELNKEDGGNRQFILVEMEEYADTITAERVRRVMKGVPDAKSDALRAGLGGTFSFFTVGDPIETSSLLSGEKLPTYTELARYIYYTATGEEFDDNLIDEAKQYIGKSKQFDVYVYYKPDIEYLKTTALTLDEARRLRAESGDRPLLVFAPTKYVEQTELDNLKITFCQLPFEIYKVNKHATA